MIFPNLNFTHYHAVLVEETFFTTELAMLRQGLLDDPGHLVILGLGYKTYSINRKDAKDSHKYKKINFNRRVHTRSLSY